VEANSRHQVLFPTFHPEGLFALEKGGKSHKGLAGVSDWVIKSIPVLTVFTIVVGNDIIELPGLP
jgi:hypothetical protein